MSFPYACDNAGGEPPSEEEQPQHNSCHDLEGDREAAAAEPAEHEAEDYGREPDDGARRPECEGTPPGVGQDPTDPGAGKERGGRQQDARRIQSVFVRVPANGGE